MELQWRSLIFLGNNSATYKFAFAETLIDLIDEETTCISLADLAVPFATHIVEHLKGTDKQRTSQSSKFLYSYRAFIQGGLGLDQLHHDTMNLVFVNVIDAFQYVNGRIFPNLLYKKNFSENRKEIVITDSLLKLQESVQYSNLNKEVEARRKFSRNFMEFRYK
jgi:hypothetical protein